MTITDMVRSVSAETPVKLMIVVKNKVKNVKLSMNPATTPSGFFFPPVSVPDKTIGRIGSIHGERIVTMPPKNANKSKIIIPYSLYTVYCVLVMYVILLRGFLNE